ncbi:centromere protein J-like [Melopsittacus undulatus]|uniref:centromere protein J-like n=1 Tax=Melopsittacus undulatus TaxID=13146 RepID=UPI00146D16F9|nr:centromere protein J-like [Melopsittacus undulatus]
MDFRKQDMEADTFKEEDHMSQQTTIDLASMVPSSNVVIDKAMPSCTSGWAENMSESSSKKCPLLYSSEASAMNGNSNVSADNSDHSQAFQHARGLNYLPTSDFFPQKLASSEPQAGIHDGNDTLEMLTPPLLPASDPGVNLCASTYKNTEQTPEQQDQVMRQQMEHLQRLVAEQQKIIALYNPGFSISHLVATIPPTLCCPATSIPVQFPAESSSQVESLERLQTSLLAMCSAQQSGSQLFMPNESSSEISGEHVQLSDSENSQLKERNFPETFSDVKEQREQVKEEIPPSPFDTEVKMKTGNTEDRPITPAIGIKQNTSEEFLEEQPEVGNYLLEKQQKEQQSKAKVTSRKAFLKRKDGTARLKKNKQKPVKDDNKHSGRAGLDCWGHLSQPGQVDAGILQPGEYSQFNLQVSGSMKIGTHEKKADNASAEWELNSRTDCEAKVVQQSLEEKQVIRRHENTKKNPIDSPQRRWPEILQPHPETLIEMNLQVGEEKENHHMHSLGQRGRTDGRPVHGTLKKNLGRVDLPLRGHRTEGAKNPLEVLQKHSLLQDLKPDHIKESELSADPAFTQDEKWVQACTQELVPGSQSSENKRRIHTGFKMVNDKIVKITRSSPEAVGKGSSSSTLQQEWQRKGTAASAWHVASSSCESSCLSSNSDDDSKSHHVQYPSQNGPQGVDHTGRRLDLSDGDYASDEPSGTRIKYVKKYSKSPPRKQDIQVISRQDFACSTSSSDSSTGATRLKESKACSSLQQSLYYPTKLKRREHEPESKNENSARDVKSLHLPPSTLSGEIPAFKIKETPAVEEPQKKLFRDRLVVFIEETQNIITRGLETGIYPRGTPPMTKVKEVQEKATHLHRTQMDQLNIDRRQELTHPLEYNRDHIHPPQKENIDHSKFKGAASVAEENAKSEEIQILKQQIAGLQEEFKRNESCWHAAYNKLRDQVEMLTRQNMELRDGLRVSEHQGRKEEKHPAAVNFMDRKSETPTIKGSVQRDDPLRSMTKEHQEKKPSNCSFGRSTTPTGRKTPHQGRLTPFEPEKPPKSILSRRSMLHQDRRISEEEVQEKIEYRDGKVEEVLTDGRRIITFRNGTKKEISADKRMTTISFFNGDVKKIMPDQRVIYYYADAQTTHTAYPDGLEVLQFPNNQIEKRYPDGTKEIVFPDRTVKCLYNDGFKETFFPDGTVVKVEKNGDKIVVFSNGQKEIHTVQFKRREYPDGTVKTVYCNGRQETKYPTGRVQIKDEEGNIILDKK